jgi:hypothetical protein
MTHDAADFSPTLHTNRRGTVVTSGWIVASVSMLIGTVVGNALPSFSSQQSQREASHKSGPNGGNRGVSKQGIGQWTCRSASVRTG